MRYLPITMKLLFLVSCLTFISWVQEKPSWINPTLRKAGFPEKTYFIGYSAHYFGKKEDLNEVSKKVRSLARASLCETIQVKIRSTSANELQNLDGISFENYRKSIVTSSSLNARGLTTEHFIDRRKGMAYGIAYVKKKELIEGYSKELKAQLEFIALKLENTKNIEDIGDNYLTYLDVLSELDELKPLQSLLRELGSPDKSDLWNAYYLIANERIEQLKKVDDLTLTAASQLLTARILENIDEKMGRLIIRNFTFKSSAMGSEFSERLKSLLIQDFKASGVNIIESNSGRYFLEGSYWPDNEKIQLSAEIKEVEDLEPVRIVSGTTLFLSKQSILDEGIDIEPVAYERAYQTSQLLAKDERADNGMHVELWTNKTGAAQVFKEGDKLKISLRVNQPAYLRLLNIWSDETAVLLMDNEFVTLSESNRILEVGQEFETKCPCGVEHLQILAQTERFEELATYQSEGFLFIDEPLREVLKKSRGNEQAENYSFSEHTITVTTLPK